MFRYLGRFAVLAVCLFALAMVGCGTDDPPVEEEPIKFVSASPAEGSTIQNDATITVTFDGTPEGLQVTGGTATPGGETVSIAGPFAAGPLVLGLQWEGDGVVLSYTVAAPPAAIVGVDPPEGSTIGEYEDIWITFDSPPAKVWVIPVSAEVDVEDNIVNIYGSFDSGPLELKIGWDGVEHTLIYNVSPPPPRALIERITPPDGSVIASNGTITVTFDNAPTDVWVTAGSVSVTGKKVTITGPFTPGPLGLTLFWADGEFTFIYTVAAPDNTPPSVTGGTVWDGDKDVDPEPINTDGVIEIEFSEEVTGNIALQTEAGGDDVGWLGKVEGNLGILQLVKGREIGNETTYVIVGTVSDASGNRRDFSITFVTKGKF